MKASRSIIVVAVSCASLNGCFLDDDEDTPVNEAPVALDDVFAVSSTNGLAVLANDSDPEGDALTLEWVDTPLFGTASVTAANTVDLELPAGFNGFTRFRYRVREARGLTAEATALVFVGIDPFKAVYLGQDGIYVNDLLTTFKVSTAEASPTQIVSMAPSANGRALAYLVRETADTFRLLYVDLEHPGVARAVNPSVIQQPIGTVGYWISPDGRHVAFELIDFTPSGPGTSLLLFDAESAAPPIRLGSIVDTRRHLALGAYPQFNAAGTHLYYVTEAAAGPDFHAIHRIDLATGLVTRISPQNGNYEGFGGYWVAHNESQIVVRYRRRAAGVFLYSSVYLLDPNQPDTLLQLNPGPDDEIAVPPTISRDGSYVFFTILGASPRPPGVVSPRIVPTAAPTGYEEIGPPEAWPAAETTGLHPSHMRADSQALLFVTRWNTASTNVFEVMHDNPSNLILVNAPTLADEVVTDGRYSADGERVFYVRRYTQTDARALEVTRREAFGTSTPLTLPADRVMSYQLDSSGRVALIIRNTLKPYLLVNADAPRVYLPVGGPGAHVAGTVTLVGR
jgi:hypothetical protein